ncbi:phage portal protein [Senegalia massiliensis]|uniref:phage portal protein n=1 Tax=Senegalia massiliensis TaxID=1720316 RepID=UPI00102F9AC2|nr:phage portal protein [Senegalia massiliensis]
MGVTDWFIGLFKNNTTVSLDMYTGEIAAELFYKELAIQASINLISNAVARSEFQTYEKGKSTRGENYYLFNVEPNKNKSSSKFWRDVIHKLIYDNECLIIQNNGYFYVADSYEVTKYAFKDYVYKDVEVDGLKLDKPYFESEVFHFELHNEKIKNVVDGLYKSYSKLIAASQGHYKKNNARRGALKIPSSYPETDKAQKALQELLSKKFKRFFEAEGGAVLPLTNGMEYEELSSNIGIKGGIEGRDIRAFIDDIFDFTAIAFQIPPQLLRGNVQDTEKVINNLLTLCINPLVELLQDEINRKYYGKQAFLERTYLKIDTSIIKSVDIKDIASALDILERIGAFSIDDSLRVLGMEPLNTKWSKARWMTKNYERVEDRFKGGG